MLPTVRTRTSIAVALIASAGMVAAGTTFASTNASSHKAGDATTLNGYHAKEIVKTFYTRSDKTVDNFDGCTMVTKLTQPVTASKPGTITVVGSAAAALDASFTGTPGELVIQLVIGHKVISNHAATQLTSNGSDDGNVSVYGYAKVPKGKTVVGLQLSECGLDDAHAFVTSRVISTTYTPFGKGKVVLEKGHAKANN